MNGSGPGCWKPLGPRGPAGPAITSHWSCRSVVPEGQVPFGPASTTCGSVVEVLEVVEDDAGDGSTQSAKTEASGSPGGGVGCAAAVPVKAVIVANATNKHTYETALDRRRAHASVGVRSRNEKREKWRPDPTGAEM
jgi:hypothetical protein